MARKHVIEYLQPVIASVLYAPPPSAAGECFGFVDRPRPLLTDAFPE